MSTPDESEEMEGKIYRRNPDMVFREIAGEMILVPIRRSADETESIYVLNETGARIWELSDGRRTLDQITGAIILEYEVERDTVERDILEYIEDMVRAGALELV